MTPNQNRPTKKPAEQVVKDRLAIVTVIRRA